MKTLYLAGPFFNKTQLDLVEKLESAIRRFQIKLYSPRSDGVLLNMSPEEKQQRKAEIFRMNCHQIEQSDLVLAVIDGRDIGTIWELGYAHAVSRYYPYRIERGFPNIVTFTNEDFGLNVMIQESVDGHLKGMDDLNQFLSIWCQGPTDFNQFKNFNAGVY